MNDFDFSTTLFYPRTTPYSILITSLVIKKKLASHTQANYLILQLWVGLILYTIEPRSSSLFRYCITKKKRKKNRLISKPDRSHPSNSGGRFDRLEILGSKILVVETQNFQ